MIRLIERVLARMAAELLRLLRDFDPQRATVGEATRVFELASDVERYAGSLKLLAASRAEKSRKWAAEGHRSAASWVAEKSKGSFGDAISTLETARRLQELPGTSEALKNGQLSSAQAKEVASAAGSDPAAERELLRVAMQGSMKKLKDRAKQVMARSSSRQSEQERYRSIHRSRFFRHWSDADGAVRLDARLAPDAGARLISSIQARTNIIFTEARSRGAQESQHAYKADALVALVTEPRPERGASRPERATGSSRSASSNGSSSSSNRGASSSGGSSRNGTSRGRTDTLVVRVDAAALRRGFVKGSETCEVPGVGPVPVATAERLLPSAFVKILVKEGVDVATVCHVGRTVSAHVQSALEERDPTCVVPQCEVAQGLENHHWVSDFAKSNTTSLASLARVCSRHHDQITYEGYRLVGGPGKWKLLAPAKPRGPDTS